MRRHSCWDTKRATHWWVHCGWDSPARLNHSVSCWSLHACKPSPLRQSCNTNTWSDTWAVQPKSHRVQTNCHITYTTAFDYLYISLIDLCLLIHWYFIQICLSSFLLLFLSLLPVCLFLSVCWGCRWHGDWPGATANPVLIEMRALIELGFSDRLRLAGRADCFLKQPNECIPFVVTLTNS